MVIVQEVLKSVFNSGGVHPIVFDTSGETNAETEKVIKNCAKYAPVWSEKSNVTPLNNNM